MQSTAPSLWLVRDHGWASRPELLLSTPLPHAGHLFVGEEYEVHIGGPKESWPAKCPHGRACMTCGRVDAVRRAHALASRRVPSVRLDLFTL